MYLPLPILAVFDPLWAVVFSLMGLVIGATIALLVSKTLGGQTISGAKRQADDLLNQARIEAQNLQRKLELDVRDELAGKREEFEKETEEAPVAYQKE